MKNTYHLKPGSFLIYGICVGTSVLIPFSFMNRPQDEGFAIILGVAWTLVLLFLYQGILRCGSDGEDLFDLIKSAFGTFFSKVLWSLYGSFIALMLSKDLAIVWSTMGLMTLPKHSPPVIAALLVIHLFLICIQGGVKTIIQISVFYSSLCLFTNIVTLVISIDNVQFENLLPIFYEGVQPIYQQFIAIATNSSGDALLLLFIPQICTEIRSNVRSFLIPLGGILLTSLIKFILAIGLLGDDLRYTLIPGAVAASALTFGNAPIRMETLVILAW